MSQIGIFGGTFNPIHWGHLLIADFAREQFNLEKILFITGARPPHRRDVQLDMEARHKMVEAAVAGNPNFEASRVELDRQGTSYTIDTLRELIKLYPKHQLNLIVGGDNIAQINAWHEADEIEKLCRILVAPRVESYKLVDAIEESENRRVIRCPLIQISSSNIRLRISEGRSIRYMVPQSVYDLLVKNNHYNIASTKNANAIGNV